MRRCQTATEYLIIVAVTIIVALIVIGVMGGIPGIGGGGGENVNQAVTASQSIGIVKAMVSPEGSKFQIQNNNPYTVTINNLTVGDAVCTFDAVTISMGQKAWVACDELTNEDAGSKYQYAFIINWTNDKTGARYTTDDPDVAIEGTVAESDGSGGSGAFSGWCYQETANASHERDGGCGLDYGGGYNGNMAAYDGNWSTPTFATTTINYTKPIGAMNTSRIEMKFTIKRTNVSFTSHPDCWAQNPLQFRADNVFALQLLQCYNGSDWISMDGEEPSSFYEEAMWWYIE